MRTSTTSNLLARWLATCLVSLLVSCSTTPSFVSQTGPVGTITRSIGVPTLQRDAHPYMLGKQSQLYRGDIVRTDNRSLIEVQLASSSRMTLSPRSELHIDESASNDNAWHNRLNLASGALEFTSGDVPEALEISTGIALVTTSDANLWVGYSAGYKRLDVVSLGDSEIIVSNQDGEIRLTAPMEATTISPGAAPRAKTVWSAARLESTRVTYNTTEP